jgi:CubicO group peptidase (beta-lactamase class C family)
MKCLLTFLLFHLIVSDIFAQQKYSLQLLNKTIDSIVLHQQWIADIPGFAVGVIVDNRIVFEKTYGVQSVTSSQRLNIRSDFHMASVSKPFAATAILQLVESGKLNPDSTVAHYLPYFKMKDERYKQVTLYHILTHSSGIPDVTNYEWDKPQSDDSAVERYVKSFTQKDLDFAPGSKFSYSNAAFDILADVIAKASGMSFEQYMRKNIFIPIGMTNSSFLLSDISPKRRTSPHIINHYLLQTVSPVYPYKQDSCPQFNIAL